jgi:ribosomal protein S20
MLGRRPPKGKPPFGHVDLNKKARSELATIVRKLRIEFEAKSKVVFHPEDSAEEGEVLSGKLKGFDQNYQAKAAWSLERTVKEIRASGVPTVLGTKDVAEGGWSFYALRLKEKGSDTVLIRSHSPTYGLGPNRIFTRMVGTELRPVSEPLLGFDHDADVLVVGQTIYVIHPERVERLFVDAEEVKRRAPESVKRFVKKFAATVSPKTADALAHACSHNAPLTRRVERLISEANLGSMKASKVRSALPDAGLSADSFGKSGALKAESDAMAKILVEIAADLYYQPRFAGSSRRVGSYRTVK